MAAFILALVVLVLAATALTLAATSAIQAAQVALSTCALLAVLPLVLFGAFKLGETLGGRQHTAHNATRGVVPPLELARGDVVKALPAPELPALPSGVSTIRAPHAPRRTRARVQAMRIAQRWFR